MRLAATGHTISVCLNIMHKRTRKKPFFVRLLHLNTLFLSFVFIFNESNATSTGNNSDKLRVSSKSRMGTMIY